MTDLFKATHCDRCASKLKGSRKMSWFNQDTICESCIKDEKELREKLPEGGSTHESFLPFKEEDLTVLERSCNA